MDAPGTRSNDRGRDGSQVNRVGGPRGGEGRPQGTVRRHEGLSGVPRRRDTRLAVSGPGRPVPLSDRPTGPSYGPTIKLSHGRPRGTRPGQRDGTHKYPLPLTPPTPRALSRPLTPGRPCRPTDPPTGTGAKEDHRVLPVLRPRTGSVERWGRGRVPKATPIHPVPPRPVVLGSNPIGVLGGYGSPRRREG